MLPHRGQVAHGVAGPVMHTMCLKGGEQLGMLLVTVKSANAVQVVIADDNYHVGGAQGHCGAVRTAHQHTTLPISP